MNFEAHLREIFPTKGIRQIKAVISSVLDEDGIGDPADFQLDRMVTVLLDTPDEIGDEAESLPVLRPPPLNEVIQVADTDDIHLRLCEMLPNYDPDFLREEADKLSTWDENAVEDCVERLLSQKKYPTIEEFNKRKQQLTCLRDYLENFKIEKFLEKFDDPCAYFDNTKRVHALTETNPPQPNYSQLLDFAKKVVQNHYYYLPLNSINEYFSYLKNDIVAVCKHLDKFKKQVMGTHKPLVFSVYPDCELLLQELAFGTHRKLIVRYLKIKDDTYRKRFDDAKKLHMLETCEICFDDELIPDECLFCMNSCIFCQTCVRTGAQTRIGDGELSVPCFKNCGSEFSMQTLQKVLKPIVYEKFAQRKQADEIQKANIEGIETCPFCDHVAVMPSHDRIFICRNDSCLKESCRDCRHESHIPFRCSEIENEADVKIRTTIEDRMTEALLRKCKKCGKQFIKSEGCNKMTCVCGTTMCYVCGTSGINYNHFGSGSCQQFSAQEELHTRNVLDAVNTAKRELGVDANPALLKFDPARGFK